MRALAWRELPDRDDLTKVELVVVYLGDENRSHGLVERCAVHVDGGADRQHEADDASVDVVVLKEALEGDRQSGRTATGKDVAYGVRIQNEILNKSRIHKLLVTLLT